MNKTFVISLFVLGLLILAVFIYKIGDNNTLGVSNVINSKVDNNIQKISDVQKTENVGKVVTVQGEVVNTLQSLKYNIAGYKIQDSTGTIDVSSSKKPQLHSTVTVTGNLYQSRYFGLVINETA
jgi:hypothetical protein